jgi:hypothetical protein
VGVESIETWWVRLMWRGHVGVGWAELSGESTSSHRRARCDTLARLSAIQREINRKRGGGEDGGEKMEDVTDDRGGEDSRVHVGVERIRTLMCGGGRARQPPFLLSKKKS